MTRNSINLMLSVLALALTMTGCGTQEADVKSELKALVQDVKPRIAPLPSPVAYSPFAYEVDSMADPFAQAKIAMKLRPGSGLQPDNTRPKQSLELFALETMNMVGAVRIAGAMHGVLKADGLLYRVRAGQYVGQNFGRVIRVSENEIVLKEMFQDNNGDWTERDATLSIQDSIEVKK